jgi:hypothetical protein
MKKIQWHALKILIILFAILFVPDYQLFAQIHSHRLQQADSLFQAKQYTQSLEHYKTILKQEQYSPSMLLKMAFVEEGLNNVGEALYYLNLYYLATKDAATLDKMEELSRKYSLEGYQTTEADRALSFYHDYYLQTSITLAAIIFFLFSVAVFMKRKHHNPVAPVVVLLFFTAALAVHTYLGTKISTGIILQPNTYLMKGPSAGASVLAIINGGHRVEIVGKKDVWLEIEWKGERAYIKHNNLLPVTL